MGVMEFLTRPAMIATHDLESPTAGTPTVGRREGAPFFDFVSLRNPRSMLTMNNRESLPSLAMTTVLFVLWGFAYGLLDILNSQFQVGMPTVQMIGLHAAYFGGYASGPVMGRLVLKHWGFKATFVTGLCIYACGTLIFWPSAVLTSFGAFVLSNLIVGTGLSVVETAANPFIALCGPMENSEIRLNISQGFQAIGGAVSPLLAKKVLFRGATNARSLIDVQWTYLGIAFFDVLLAVAFYYMPIPEASDEDLVELANRRREANAATIGKVPIVWLTLGLGVFSQFCYVGGQEALNMNFQRLVGSMEPR
jgi:fucose permease